MEKPFSLNFKMDEVQDIDDLAEHVTVWEKVSLAHSKSGSISLERRTYYRGVADAMQAVRLQLTKLHVGLKPIHRDASKVVSAD